MANLSDLAKRMRNLSKSLPEQASLLAAKTALVITYQLTDVTPVDTSRALSNWQLYLGSRSNKSIFPYYPGKHGSTELVSEQYADLAALRQVQFKRPGQAVYISNNLTYIDELNSPQTKSKQTPPGFVERAVLKGRLFVRSEGLNTEKLLRNGAVDKNFGDIPKNGGS